MLRMNYRVFFVLVFASLALLLGDRKGLFFWPRFGVQVVVNPVEQGLYSLRNAVFESVSFISFWHSGEARIKNLEQKNWELTSKLVLMNTLENENKAMRAQLGAAPMVKRSFLPAQILGTGQGMEIALGAVDGVREGMTVTYAGNLVGRIGKVLPHTAFVVVPTEGSSKIPVEIGEVHAVAVGAFGSQIILDKVGQTDEIQVGDLVQTSGEGGSYVPGLVVGEISKITGEKTDLFRQAEVEPLVDFGKLGTVFIIGEHE